MSFFNVKNEIDRFLKSAEPEVLAIKGDWGVGKTFAWHRLLQEAKNENRISLDIYSYVSLFGIDSLDSFKIQIFEQQISSQLIGTTANLETLKNNTDRILEELGKKTLPLINGIPMARSFAPALESVAFLSLTKTLICIDDLERKGRNLPVKDILGLISLLKEQKQCKVVLILNDSSFEDPKFLEEYEVYKEKVIDIELQLEPSSQECVEVALDERTVFFPYLSKYITSLNIKNIRIIKKIEKVAYLLSEYLKDYESEVLEQAIHGLVLFSWSYYVRDAVTPPLDYIKSIGLKMTGADDRELSDQEKLWQSALVEYNFQGVDGFDLQIADAVVTGYIKKPKLLAEAKKVNKQVLAAKSGQSFEDAWRLYHDSFDQNEDVVLTGIHRSLKKHTKYLSPMDLNASVLLFRDMNWGRQADEVIEHFINERNGETEVFNLDEYIKANYRIDSKIIARFSEMRGEQRQNKTLKQVLDGIAQTNNYDGYDLDVLAKANEDDFYQLFKSEKGPHLDVWISICLKFGHLESASNREQQIAMNATQALLGIASESRMNARRVAKFGISI